MSESEKPADEPKIIVDDDWKAQVEKEKEQAADGDDQIAADDAADAVVQKVVQQDDGTAAEMPADAGSLPPASLEVHVSMLFSQCLAALGQMPGPDGKPTEVNKPFAKHFIDTVEMLQEKTEGNVTDEEKKMLADVLHAMRMAFVGSK